MSQSNASSEPAFSAWIRDNSSGSPLPGVIWTSMGSSTERLAVLPCSLLHPAYLTQAGDSNCSHCNRHRRRKKVHFRRSSHLRYAVLLRNPAASAVLGWRLLGTACRPFLCAYFLP